MTHFQALEGIVIFLMVLALLSYISDWNIQRTIRKENDAYEAKQRKLIMRGRRRED